MKNGSEGLRLDLRKSFRGLRQPIIWWCFHEHDEPRMKVSTQSQNICFKVEFIKLYYWLTMRSKGEIVVKDDAHGTLLENWVVPIR